MYRFYNYVLVNGFRQRSLHRWRCETPWLHTSPEFSSISQLWKILTIYYVVNLFCALHAAAAKLQTYKRQQRTLTFCFAQRSFYEKEMGISYSVLRKGNRQFVLRFMGHYERKKNVSHLNRSATIQKQFRNHPNTNPEMLSKQYGAKPLCNVHVDCVLN